MEYNREWEYGTPVDCDCENNFIHVDCGCKQKDVCECENILLEISNLKSEDIVLQREIDAISGASISGVTEEEVDAKIASAKTEIEAEIPSLSGYATETFVSAFTYDKATIDEKVAGGGSFDPSQYYNKTATDALLDEKLDVTAYTPTDLSNYYTKTEVDNEIISAITDVEAEIPTVPTSNTAFTNDAGYLTEHQSLSGYATEQWVEDKHYITGVDLSNYATKAEIPVVPTSNTAFTNDAGYLTEHQSLTAYSTTQEVNTMINQSVSGKQDTLSAGTNITIVDNVISAQGGGATYTAGTGIDITNNVISAVIKFWCGTMSEYEQISQPDNNTIYLIHS